MSNKAEMQELFDTYTAIPAAALCMMYDMEKVQEDNLEHIKAHGLTDKVYDDYATVAEKYGLSFMHPKYTRGMKAVPTGATVH